MFATALTGLPGLLIHNTIVSLERKDPNSHISSSGVLKSSHLPRMSSWPELPQWLFLYIASIAANNPHNNYFNMALGGFMFLKFNFNNYLTESH